MTTRTTHGRPVPSNSQRPRMTAGAEQFATTAHDDPELEVIR